MFKRKRPAMTVIVVLALMIAAAGALIMMERIFDGTIYAIAEARAVQMATEAVNKAVQQEVAGENLQYQDFINIHKDNQGRVALMQANTVKVNQVIADTTLAVEKRMEELKWQSFSIPFGLVFGSDLLASYGPKIKVYIMPVGTVRANVSDKFETAGINQTRHKIYLGFDTSVRIVVPSKSGEAEITTQVPLAESVIVGDVPDTFVSISGGLFSK
ncbi:MAG: sporulation protein YunB [Peptococcaceae bacterium]|jgi:sporulation protein YunB|nr:MAG: sporulation protein YunB [Peptococcaceae bacterium]